MDPVEHFEGDGIEMDFLPPDCDYRDEIEPQGSELSEHEPGEASESESDWTSDERLRWKQNPQLMQFFKDMYLESIKDETDLHKAPGKQPRKPKKSKGKSVVEVPKVKSPSDTTIYAPVI